MNGYNYPDNLLALFVYYKKNWSLKKYYKNSHHCWTESLVDLQEDQLIPQYYYVSTSNKHVNKKDGKQMIIDLTTVVFADRTRSKFTIDCCWPLFNFNFNSSKCCC